MDQDLYKKLKENPDMIEQVLNPGRYLHEIKAEELPITVMPSGYPSLDEYLLLKRGEGELIILGARPSIGKSALAFGIGLRVSLTEEVHVFSLEMGHTSIGRRLLSLNMGCSITDIQLGKVNNRIPDGIKSLTPYKFFLDDRSGLTADEICDAARNHHRRKGTSLIIIDYIQIMGIEKGHSRTLEIAEATSKLKALGKELKCPIILLSQLNRSVANRGEQSGVFEPTLSDLRDSGSLEQDADIVLGLHRQYMFRKSADPQEAKLLVLKNRNGSLGEINLKFDPNTSSFIDPKDEGI